MTAPATGPVKGSATGPVTSDEFAALMAQLGTFERRPEIAVAVSGGADSMSAALLTHEWARSRGGHVIALTVDHALRPESAAEAALVAQRLSDLGIEAAALCWSGEKPAANLQAAAREARYGLMADYCARRGILHLVLGHHQDDQAETFLMRLSRGSGLYGLASMSPLQELPDHRLLRPLLTLPKARLERTLEARGVDWVEDPSNLDPKFSRTRFRELLPTLVTEGLSAAKLAETTERLGQTRNTIEASVSAVLARAVSIHPAGIASVHPDILSAAPKEVALRCLSRILMTVSGAGYGPRMERLEALYEKIVAGLTSGATLSGCRLTPWRQSLILYRENRHLVPITLKPGHLTHWDGRFDVIVSSQRQTAAANLRIGPLAREGWAEVRKQLEGENLGFPPLAGEAVPAFRDSNGVVAVPHLGYFREATARGLIEKCRFRSGNSLTGVAFTVA